MTDLSELLSSALEDMRLSSYADSEALRNLRRSIRKASGFVDYGAVPAEALDNANPAFHAVNEGLWTSEDHNLALYTTEEQRNVFYLGAAESAAVSMSGRSKNPTIDIDRVEFELGYLNTPDGDKNINLVRLPPCPDGRTVVNALTGTRTTYLTPQDAFDFITPNSDFRTSVANWVSFNSASLAVTSGSMTITNEGNSAGEMTHQTASLDVGVDYEVEILVTDASDGPTMYYQTQGGDVTHNLALGKNTFLINTDLQNAKVFVRPNGPAANGYVKLGRFAIRPTHLSVVTNPVDTVAFESFFELVTEENPYVYYHGSIQSRPNLIDGIGTIESSRPLSYYAAYEGDKDSRGTCVDFFSLTRAQQQKILNNPKHNLVSLGEGILGQRRIRQLGIEGVGNGDWYVGGKVRLGKTYDCNGTSAYGFFSSTGHLGVQGKNDTRNFNADNTDHRFFAYNAPENTEELRAKGVFTGLSGSGIPSDRSDDGRVYLYHFAAVPRLNTGVADSSNNPMGTALCCNIVGGYVQGGVTRHEVDPTSTTVARTTSECFAPFIEEGQSASLNNPGRYRDSNGYDSGTVESGLSGRHDGKLTGIVYSDGVGGVIDHRFEADVKVTEQKFSKVFDMVKSGMFRGAETLKRSTVIHSVKDRPWRFVDAPANMTVGVSGSLYSKHHPNVLYRTNLDFSTVSVGDYGVVLLGSEWFKLRVSSLQVNNDVVEGIHYTVVDVSSNFGMGSYFTYVSGFYANGKSRIVVCGLDDTGIPVSGEFYREDAYGEVNRILADDMLQDGWMGSFITEIPDGTGKEFRLTRKIYNASSTRHVTYSRDNGTTWTYVGLTDTVDVDNAVVATIQADEYGLQGYGAWAKLTKVNSRDNRPVLLGRGGLSFVDYSGTFYSNHGNLLTESLTASYSIDGDNGSMGTTNVTYFLLSAGQKINPNSTYRPRVQSLENRYPTAVYKDNSSGVRCIPYLTEADGYLDLGFISEQIVWDNNVDNISEATILASNVSHGFTKGETYSFNGGNLIGQAFVALETATFTPDTQLVVGDDGLYNSGGDLVFQRWGGNGYGYEEHMDVPDGAVLTTDQNGNSVVKAFHTLSLPIGHI